MESSFNPAAPLPDLGVCDREPIHSPGSIQPHGCLLALSGEQLRIVQASCTCEPLLGVAPSGLLGRELGNTLGSELHQSVQEGLARHRVMPAVAGGFAWQVPGTGLALAGYVHQSGDLTVLELEPLAGDDPAGAADPAPAMAALHWVRAESGLEAKAQSAAALLQQLTGFDRVMVYRFDADWHGEVIAESRGLPQESYLGLHYPASDIPAQARRLYLVNPTRVIADRDVVQSPIIALPAVPGAAAGPPLDLTKSLLRSVSPVHLEYLRNMGVRASLSSALIRDCALWGLIACHHGRPRRLGRGLRELLGWMVQDLATQLALAEEVRTRHYAVRLKASRNRVISAMRAGARLTGLIQGPALADVLGAIGADGVALIRDRELTTGGVTPEPMRIRAIVDGLMGCYPDDPSGVFLTDCLSQQVPTAADLAPTAAGLALFPLVGPPLVKLMWFRGEQVRRVAWAGNPDKATTLAPDGRLGPRKSFAAWIETVRLRSLPWTAEEVESARHLTALVDIELHKTVEDALRASLADVQRLEEALRDQALRDPLTGLFNRRYLDMTLPREIERRGRCDEPLAVAVLDLDGFEAFTDTHGLAAGDLALRAIGGLLLRSLGGGEIACRSGGGEFTLLLPNATLEQARGRLEGLRQALTVLPLRGGGEEFPPLSASIGVAVAGGGDRAATAAALLARADGALNRAKEQGRNRVVVAD